MKKILMIVLVLGLIFCLSGCVKVHIEQKICANGTVEISYDGKYQDSYMDYLGMTPEEYFGVAEDQIPTEIIDGEVYYAEQYVNAITLGEFYNTVNQPIAGGVASTVHYSFEVKDGVEYCTIEIEQESGGFSAEDMAAQLLALDNPTYNYEGFEKIVADTSFVFENGIAGYTCSPDDVEAISADIDSVTVNLMKLRTSVPVTITGVVGYVTPEEGQPFTDVRKDSYYADAVKWALANNVTKGTSATTFSPAAECNRAQVVTFLWNAAGQPLPNSSENPFTDVKQTDWYYNAVLWAVENKITSGTSATTFSPMQLCRNSHIVTFLWNANGKPGNTDSSAAWYADAYAWAAKEGLLEGVPGVNTPESTCPRSNIVMLLMKQYSK